MFIIGLTVDLILQINAPASQLDEYLVQSFDFLLTIFRSELLFDTKIVFLCSEHIVFQGQNVDFRVII